MIDSLKSTGSPSIKELQNSPGFPKKEDFLRGPIAVIECIEDIPCNPCETSCPKGAIIVGKPITNLPRINFDKCTGCGICSAACPGLAIYIKDYTYSENNCLISFPYEYLPLPQIGESIILTGRNGEEICEGRVVRINNAKINNHTPIISATYSKEYFNEVITMKRRNALKE